MSSWCSGNRQRSRIRFGNKVVKRSASATSGSREYCTSQSLSKFSSPTKRYLLLRVSAEDSAVHSVTYFVYFHPSGIAIPSSINTSFSRSSNPSGSRVTRTSDRYRILWVVVCSSRLTAFNAASAPRLNDATSCSATSATSSGGRLPKDGGVLRANSGDDGLDIS
jgi:hypothetical protein